MALTPWLPALEATGSRYPLWLLKYMTGREYMGPEGGTADTDGGPDLPDTGLMELLGPAVCRPCILGKAHGSYSSSENVVEDVELELEPGPELLRFKWILYDVGYMGPWPE